MTRSPGRRVTALAVAALTALLTSANAPAAPGAEAASSSASEAQVLAARMSTTTQGSEPGRWARAVDTSDRAAVEAAYLSQYAAGESVPTGWTGNLGRCVAGTSSAVSRAATLRAVNFARSLGGLAPVTFDATLNARSQGTALMMSANRGLSHAPPRSWHCWTREAATNAGRSNLALSYPSLTSAGLVDLYLSEPGAGNRAVGHRRWLLNPFATRMGSGSTDTANAMTVIGPTSPSRPDPRWVAWPTAGWFPAPLEPAGRWSLSAGDGRTTFSRATVQVWRNGTRVSAVKQRVENGYARPTLVWQLASGGARSGTFKVVVRGIHRSGSSRASSTSYTVSMFTPTS